ncbi:unnamed protein product [Penicillium olsonii]|nr:unnamed protein product [Penicillium olsonii]
MPIWAMRRAEAVKTVCSTLATTTNDRLRAQHEVANVSSLVCGFVHRSPKDGNGDLTFGFPIVGLDPLGEGTKDPEVKRLKTIDPETEGLRVKLTGGSYKGDANDQKPKTAGAIIDFQCDHERSGLEGLYTLVEPKQRRRREEEAAPKTNTSSLQFKSFGPSDDDTYILRLDWRTKYACDNYEEENGSPSSSKSWGFFTWLIVIAFLCIAAYLIFGSWLNYNRYGARGWDLLPHGDTIRDVPYIFQDWLRRVVNTLQGAGSRGGYSAV